MIALGVVLRWRVIDATIDRTPTREQKSPRGQLTDDLAYPKGCKKSAVLCKKTKTKTKRKGIDKLVSVSHNQMTEVTEVKEDDERMEDEWRMSMISV